MRERCQREWESLAIVSMRQAAAERAGNDSLGTAIAGSDNYGRHLEVSLFGNPNDIYINMNYSVHQSGAPIVKRISILYSRDACPTSLIAQRCSRP